MTITKNAEGMGANCLGTNHTHASALLGTCDNCGHEVAQREDNHAIYNVFRWGQFDARRFACWAPHTCDPEAVELWQAMRAEAIAEGRIVKFSTVEVFKGRKVPLGTVGEVFWIGTDAFGNEKVGIKTTNGETHWTAKSNVRGMV